MEEKNTYVSDLGVSERKRVGIMGGTFDPIHYGHLILGESAYEQFRLDRVLFMPSGNPPHKPVRDGGASNEARTEMVRRAICNNARFELSLEEMHDEGYNYTSKTLEKLTAANPDTDYYFILGADSLVQFNTWRRPDQICRLCTIVVAVRNHLLPEEMDMHIENLEDLYGARILKLSTDNLDISSSQIRQWLRDGRSCRYYLPDQVLDYIASNNIYAGEG